MTNKKSKIKPDSAESEVSLPQDKPLNKLSPAERLKEINRILEEGESGTVLNFEDDVQIFSDPQERKTNH